MSVRVLYSGLTKEETRGVEQLLLEARGLQKGGGTLLNQINTISKSNDPDKYNRLVALGMKIIDSATVPPEKD